MLLAASSNVRCLTEYGFLISTNLKDGYESGSLTKPLGVPANKGLCKETNSPHNCTLKFGPFM